MIEIARGFDYTTTLGVCWSKRENDFNIYYPRKVDGWVMHDILRSDAFKEFKEEVKNRGYDLETIRFSVKLKDKYVK